MKKKHQPSEKIQSEIAQLLSVESATRDMLSDLSRQGMRLLVQRALEAEAEEHLARPWYKRRSKEAPVTGHRNGYERRVLKTAIGRVAVQQPRLRNTSQPFRSMLIKRIGKVGYRLIQLATEMYVRGLSTRDIEHTLTDEDGKPILTRSVTSRLTDELYKEYESFAERDLSKHDVVYLFLDGVYESVRKYTNGQTILCAWAILSDGRKEMLHLAAAESESQASWELFFEEIIARGLRQPLLIISDGAKGLHAAITRSFPRVDRQRCIAHKLRNLLSKLPKDEALRKQIATEVNAIYYAPDRETADTLTTSFLDRHTNDHPSMVKCFNDDLEACLTHLSYPVGHRKFIRTTNQLERSFLEEKRRTKIIPSHTNERAALKLVFGVLIRVSRKWIRVRMTKLELAQLRNLRNLKADNQDNKYISYRLAA